MKDCYWISWMGLVYLFQRHELNKPAIRGLTLSSTGTDGDGADSSHVLLGSKTLGDKFARAYVKEKKRHQQRKK